LSQKKTEMKLPILSYGHGILRQKCEVIQNDYPGLTDLITNMWDTLYHANGCGLAATQVGKQIRLFIVDSISTYDNIEPAERKLYFELDDTGIIETFINAHITERYGCLWEDEEGCLSIPGMSSKVKRPWYITIEFFDRNYTKQRKTFGGSTARIIQHEYDHTDGIFYIDHINSLTKRLLDNKLRKASKGLSPVKYPMKFIK
jgi:peptide deformylase